MKTLMKPVFIALALGALLSSCTVGPDYQRPAMDLPIVADAAPANATIATSSRTWWTVYGDPLLNQLMDEVLKNNLDLAAAAARITEVEALTSLAVSDQMPSAYATASRERNRNSEASGRAAPNQPVETTTNRAALNVSFEIDFWGKYRRATQAARAELLSVEANRDALRLSLATQGVQGYFNLRALDSRIAATERAIQRADEAVEMQQKRFNAGVISEFEFLQRKAEVDAARVLLPPLHSQRGNQERALNVLLGRSPREIMARKVDRAPLALGPVAPGNVVVAPAGLASELLLRRPDLIEAEQKLVAANARIGVARAAYFPSVTLTGLFGGESSSLGDLFSGPARIWNFAGNLTQPLWGAGRVGRQVDVAEARNEQAVAQYRSAIANAFREVQDAVHAQTSARAVFDIEQGRVVSLNKSWELVKLRYQNGIASQLDVIDTERLLLLAELNRIEAERGLRAAVADLYKALGG